jgi:G3E family GTPase
VTEPRAHLRSVRLESGALVHLVAGLPTPAVLRVFDEMRDEASAQTFAEFAGSAVLVRGESTILLPSHIEPSALVEDWEACGYGYLTDRLGEGARIASVVTVVDADFLNQQLGTAEPISAYGWGKTAWDGRSVADIVVGQIESATHLLVVGRAGASGAIHRLLGLLNPAAPRCTLAEGSRAELRDFVASPRPLGAYALSEPTARIVPPWLELLQGGGEGDLTRSTELFMYRRSLPFDQERFGEWLQNPPLGLVRGKGSVWLADDRVRAFGYSCAGAVHRVFAAGPWWAGRRDGAWPTCETHRSRLLERWHPRFGDRRQEIVFIGLGLDPSEVSAALDACLLSEAAALESLLEGLPTGAAGERASVGLGLH